MDSRLLRETDCSAELPASSTQREHYLPGPRRTIEDDELSMAFHADPGWAVWVPIAREAPDDRVPPPPISTAPPPPCRFDLPRGDLLPWIVSGRMDTCSGLWPASSAMPSKKEKKRCRAIQHWGQWSIHVIIFRFALCWLCCMAEISFRALKDHDHTSFVHFIKYRYPRWPTTYQSSSSSQRLLSPVRLHPMAQLRPFPTPIPPAPTAPPTLSTRIFWAAP